MQYDHIVILRTRLKSAARQTKCHQQAVSSGGGRVGAVRVQRGSLGGQWRRREKLRVRRGRLYCPGRGPGRPPVRTRAPQPPPACAPLSGSPRPASAAAGCLLLSRLHASGAQPSLGLALVLGRVRKARSHCTDKLVPGGAAAGAGAQSAAVTAVHQRRLGQEEGGFCEGSQR